MTFRKEEDIRRPLSVFSYASLTDIILLLLIFFLLTSSFVTNLGIQVEMPEAETGAAAEPNFVNVTITDDGRFYVMGNLVERADLTTAIREQHQRNPEALMVLRSDRNAIIDDAVRVMNIAQALNMRVMMATERPTD